MNDEYLKPKPTEHPPKTFYCPIFGQVDAQTCLFRQEKARKEKPGFEDLSAYACCRDCEHGLKMKGEMTIQDLKKFDEAEFRNDFIGLITDIFIETKPKEEKNMPPTPKPIIGPHDLVRKCVRCGEFKPLKSGFSTSILTADGYQDICKACRKKERAAHRKALKKKQSKIPSNDVAKPEKAEPEKTCIHCKQTKPESEFAKSYTCKDGRSNVCKVCRNKQKRDLERRRKGNYIPPLWKTAGPTEFAGKFIPANDLKNILIINLKDHPDLLDRINQIAQDELRTPEMQALYIIREALQAGKGAEAA